MFPNQAMTPKYFQTQTSHRDRWLVSYADVLTILLTLFVTIAAQGLAKARKPAPAPPAKSAVDAPPLPVSSTLLRAKKLLEANQLDVRTAPEGIVISLPQAILFSSGADQISPDALPMLAGVADVLRDIPNRIRLVGHADAVPVHNRQFNSNWELSMARTLRVMELLSQRFGVPEDRFSIASFGQYRPAGSNDTPDGRARNRRVEILILAEATP